MTSDLRAAVVGCGGAGTNHAVGYERAAGVEPVAVCDLDEERARDLAAERDVQWYADVATMLEVESPDVVSVATPEAAHVEPTIAALEADADVFCEKIMAHSLADGRRMVEAAERTGGVLGVDYNYRYIPAFERLAAAVGGDALGDPRLVTVDAHAFCWHHAIDLLRLMLGDPVAVAATSVRDDEREFWAHHDELLYVPAPTAAASLTFPDGTVASLSASRHGGWPEEQMLDLRIRGTEGRAGVTDVRTGDTSGEPLDGALREELADCESITLAESFHRSIRAFVDALRTGERPPTTGEDGLAAMKVERAVAESARAGRTVEL